MQAINTRLASHRYLNQQFQTINLQLSFVTIETERLISPVGCAEDRIFDKTIRPQCLNDYIGQPRTCEQMEIFITAAKARGEALDHVLIFGPPGLGKCITADSYILTEFGWTPFANLIPPHLKTDSYLEKRIRVYGLQGFENTSHIYSNGIQETLCLTTNAGFSLQGTPNHPVMVATPHGLQWKSLGDLTSQDWIAITQNMQKLVHPQPVDNKIFIQNPVKFHGSVISHIKEFSDKKQRKVSRIPHYFSIALNNMANFIWCYDIGRRVAIQCCELPAFILDKSASTIAACLRGIFETIGQIRQTHLELPLHSNRLTTQIQLLLTHFGIIAHRPRDPITGLHCQDQLLITGNQFDLLQKWIGFKPPRPARSLPGNHFPDDFWNESPLDLIPYTQPLLKTIIDQTILPTSAAYPQLDALCQNYLHPLSRQEVEKSLNLLGTQATWQPEMQILKQLCHPNIYWDRVATLTPGRAPVYDFCVPNSHSFVANGFYNHNTTLAHITANEMGVNLRQTSGPILEKPGDLAALLTNLEPRDVLFIDEIHRLSPVVEEILYPAMEDFQLDIMIGEGPAARSIKLDLKPFTLIGATTRAGLLTSPLRDRFGITHRLEFYNSDELAKIITRASNILNVPIDPDGTTELAHRSRGTPRIANRLLRRVRDYAQVRADGHITLEVAKSALDLLNVDIYGLDMMDRKLLLAIMEKFDGGPVGIESLAAAIGEERGTIEEVIEPFLIQQGFLMRTPRGRVATRLAWQHFDLKPHKTIPELQDDMFENP